MTAYYKGIGFIHIPKTGGTSIKKWLCDFPETIRYQTYHPKGSDLIQKHPDISYMFTVVRNPWARLVSQYKFLLKHKDRIGPKIGVDISVVDFNTFIEKFLHTKTDLWFTLATPQVEWLDCKVDLILKQETLNDDFKVIQKMLNKYDMLPLTNATGNVDYRDYYSEEQKDFVGNIFLKDVETFNYQY